MRISGRAGARAVLLGSILLLLSLSNFAIFRVLSPSSPSPPVRWLMPTLNYEEVNGDSQVSATITLSNGCLHLRSWGTPVRSGNSFSVTATIVDVAGPSSFCTMIVIDVHHTYSLGQLAKGNNSFTLSACMVFPQYGGAIRCSNKASLSFQVGVSNQEPLPIGDNNLIEYQDLNGHSIVNATITVPPCSRLRDWSDPSQFGNSFRSNVTMVNDSRLMIACIAIDTFAHNSYDLGKLSPDLYSFTLRICEISIGWDSKTTDCSRTHTIFFIVPRYSR